VPVPSPRGGARGGWHLPDRLPRPGTAAQPA
jgi:hypothetical protein